MPDIIYLKETERRQIKRNTGCCSRSFRARVYIIIALEYVTFASKEDRSSELVRILGKRILSLMQYNSVKFPLRLVQPRLLKKMSMKYFITEKESTCSSQECIRYTC